MKYSHLSETVTIKKVSEKDNVGVFHIEGLYTGYGVTLGNAFRRVLLSSLPGAAITQVKIKNVEHEFSTLPGMMEDIVEFTLNLKKVRFHFDADEPQVLKLRVKGEREVKAEDIESTMLVQVINKDLHLATLTKKTADLDMEITVEKGLGYVMSESRKMERLSVGMIVLDAIFSPVVRVAFHSEDMRVGDRTDYNRLKLEIETDGSVTPSEALHKASNILKDHFEKTAAIEVTPVEREGKTEKKKK
jgi:DNA-directed RNA polymerase subunit alpha